jgi:hypothetical protein
MTKLRKEIQAGRLGRLLSQRVVQLDPRAVTKCASVPISCDHAMRIIDSKAIDVAWTICDYVSHGHLTHHPIPAGVMIILYHQVQNERAW